ncbi:MAG: winged helix-turn-helix domain-containing protein [Geminicoccaceae bacterium]
MSRRSSARLFSVAASTAIKWVDKKRRTGSVEPQGDEIVSLGDDTDLSCAELVGHVWQTHGLKVAPSTIRRLLDRHDMTYKKPHTPPNSIGLMSCADGKPTAQTSIRSKWPSPRSKPSSK